MSDASLNIKIGGDVKDAVTAIDATKAKLAELYAKLDEAKRRQDKLIDPSNIAAAGKEISSITKEIDALGNNQGFKTLGDSTGNLVKGANDAFGAIRKIAYILPGVGIAGIFSLAFEGVAEIIKEVTSAMSDAEIENKSYSASLSEAGKKIGDVNEDVHRMAALFKDARDGVVSKTTVLNEYNKKFGDSLGIAKDYNTAEAFFTSKTEAYLNAMKQRAIADAAYSLAKKEIADQIEKNAKNELTLGTTLKASIAQLFSATGAGNSFSKSIKDSDEQSKKLIDSYNKVGDAAELAAQKIAQAANININGKTKATKTQSVPDTLAATERALQEINKLTADLGKADTRPLFERLAESIDPNQAEALKTKIALVIRNNTRDGIAASITKDEVALLNKKLSTLQNPDLKIKIPIGLETENFDSTIKTELKKLDKFAFLKLDWKIDIKSISPQLDRLNKDLTGIVSSFQGELIAAAAEAIGTALGSGGNVLKAAGTAIVSEIGGLLKQLGEALIKYSTYKEIAINIAELNPLIGLAAGVAAEIAGSALIASASSARPHAFAEGGIVTKATYGVFGEAGPEAIIPLSQMDKFAKNTRGAADMHVVFKGSLQGNDIRLSQQRTAKQQRVV